MNFVIPEKLLELLDQPGITDILISSSKSEIDRGNGLEQVTDLVASEAELTQLARELIELGGRRLDQANPFADVSLPGGLRVHAVLESACSAGTLLSIRLHNPVVRSLEELQQEGFVNFPQLEQLLDIKKQRQSFLISGSTGTGKTTLLRSMLKGLDERIIVIEDTTELKDEGTICLQTRSQNIELKGSISLEQLVREALRMRPDRIVIGEVRGLELLVMLQALNTGHSGATTIHANSMDLVPERLMAIAGGKEISEQQLARLAVAAFDWVISLERTSNSRRVAKIGRLYLDSGELRIREHFPVPRLALA